MDTLPLVRSTSTCAQLVEKDLLTARVKPTTDGTAWHLAPIVPGWWCGKPSAIKPHFFEGCIRCILYRSSCNPFLDIGYVAVGMVYGFRFTAWILNDWRFCLLSVQIAIRLQVPKISFKPEKVPVSPTLASTMSEDGKPYEPVWTSQIHPKLSKIDHLTYDCWHLVTNLEFDMFGSRRHRCLDVTVVIRWVPNELSTLIPKPCWSKTQLVLGVRGHSLV